MYSVQRELCLVGGSKAQTRVRGDVGGGEMTRLFQGMSYFPLLGCFLFFFVRDVSASADSQDMRVWALWSSFPSIEVGAFGGGGGGSGDGDGDVVVVGGGDDADGVGVGVVGACTPNSTIQPSRDI